MKGINEMKKNRLTALILTFVLLFGCLSILPVAADEAVDGQLTIVAQNVVYGEKIQIAYAVDTILKLLKMTLRLITSLMVSIMR